MLGGINQQNDPDAYAAAEGALADARTARGRWRSRGHHPYRLERPRSREYYESSVNQEDKIVIALTQPYIAATINAGNLWTDTNTVAFLDNPDDALVIAGILNSGVVSSIYRMGNPDQLGRAMPQVTAESVRELPFPRIRDDSGDLAIDSDQYDGIANAVTGIQGSLRVLDTQPVGQVTIQERRNINQMVNIIEDIVLTLFGITDEEERRLFARASGDIRYY